MPESMAPAFTDGLECAAHRITLLGVDCGSTVSPSVSREPSAVMTSSPTTFQLASNVRAWILPSSSDT